MSPAPVLLHDRAQARAALAAGHDRFLTPPDGALAAGESFYRHLFDGLDAPVEAILDCADDGAAAVEALGNGWRAVVLRGPARRRVRRIADRLGATLYTRPPRAIEFPAPSRL